MKQLHEALTLIEQNEGRADFEAPKPDELIEKAEKALGLVFPATYREFLRRLGCGDIAGAEFYGLIDDDFENSSVPDAVWLTLNERRESQLPKSLILVASADAVYYAIDCAQSSGSSENPVVICGPGGEGAAQVAADFGEFFLNTIRDALSN